MTSPAHHLLAALMRQNFFAFLMKCFETLNGGKLLRESWYLLAMCHELVKVWRAPTDYLAILVPPRHLKSITASVAYTAWLLGQDPTMKIMVASYSEDLSRRHAAMVKTIMQSPWYRQTFPGTRIDPRNNRATEFHTTAGGVRKDVTVEGAITGFGADIIIMDDCMKAEDARSPVRRQSLRDWYDNTLVTRPDNKAAAKVISIQQRLHEDDLPAHLIAKGYRTLVLPAIAEKQEYIEIGPGQFHLRMVGELLNPERESLEVLEALRRQMGPMSYNAQYQQDPVTPEGNMIRMEWFGTFEEEHERHEFLKVVQSWDTGMTASGGSWTVCITAGFHRETRKWHILDVYRDKLDYPDIRKAVVRLWRKWQADAVLIEDAASGMGLWAEFRASGPLTPIMIRPAASKEERFNSCLGEVEAGHFLLPVEASWLDTFRHELKAFPLAANDDQVDSFSQLVSYQLRHWKWLITEYNRNGRVRQLVRIRERPW